MYITKEINIAVDRSRVTREYGIHIPLGLLFSQQMSFGISCFNDKSFYKLLFSFKTSR